MSDGTANAHLQIEWKQFAFIALADALHPRCDDGFVITAIYIDEQKEQAILRNSDALAEILAFKCVMHEEFIVIVLQAILEWTKKEISKFKYSIERSLFQLTSVKLSMWKVRTWFSIRQIGTFSVLLQMRHE